MTVITIYALFGDDIRAALLPSASDPYFNGLTIFAMFCFTIEIILSSIVIGDYFLGFYFWLDIIATVSLIFDISWIWDLM